MLACRTYILTAVYFVGQLNKVQMWLETVHLGLSIHGSTPRFANLHIVSSIGRRDITTIQTDKRLLKSQMK